MHALNGGRRAASAAPIGTARRKLSTNPPRRPARRAQAFFGGSDGAGGDFSSFFGNSGGSGSGPEIPYEAQETIFFFGADGSVSRVPGRRRVVVVRPPSSSAGDAPPPSFSSSPSPPCPLPPLPEGLYLSPAASAAARAAAGGHLPMPVAAQQGICVASTFSLQATNGRDPSRRISFEGFVQLPEVLEEAVEASVLSRGGEVLVRERDVSPELLASRLAMRVAVPLLFGVPEEWRALRETIESAGGIVHQVQRSWGFYGPV